MLSLQLFSTTRAASNRYRSKQIAIVGAAAFGGFLAINATKNEQRRTILDGSLKFQEGSIVPSSSLMVPTLEATVRAARLVSTAILIVGDYKYAQFVAKISPESNPWGNRKIEYQKQLEEAQITYTNDTPEEEILKTGKTRKEIIKEQKDAVHLAAQRVAEAEEQVERLGSRKRDTHLKAANRLLELCEKNGGCYIKIGQHLANLDYLIPDEYIKTLSSLFNSTPQSSFESVCKVVEEDLGCPIDELFCDFEEKPIASASLAQVYVAYEKGTGKKLAVKVQHRGLRETSAGDIFALQTVIRGIENVFQDFTWGWIADEIAPQLPKELDFLNEGRNAETAARYIRDARMDDSVIVPEIHWDKSSSRVLCMDFEEGFTSTDEKAIKDANLRNSDIAHLVSCVFQSQMFDSGFVHCDPHPANVLIRPHPKNPNKPQMVLVDHGLYKRIDDEFRIQYANLWQALMLADLKGIKKYSKSLGVDKMYPLFAAMLTSRPYDEFMDRAKSGSLSNRVRSNEKSDKAMIKGYAQQYLGDIFEMLGTLPRQMLLLLKMNDCLRHIDTSLGNPGNTLIIAGKYASCAVYKDRIKNDHSFTSKFNACWDYVKILFRIQVHDFHSWCIQNLVNYPLIQQS